VRGEHVGSMSGRSEILGPPRRLYARCLQDLHKSGVAFQVLRYAERCAAATAPVFVIAVSGGSQVPTAVFAEKAGQLAVA
jgi:hypothetical protein